MANFKRTKKVEYKGIKFDSEAEKRFYVEYLEHCPYLVKVHPKYQLYPKYKLLGITHRERSYKPDFEVLDEEGKTIHIYDVKASITPREGKNGPLTPKVFIDSAMKLRIDDFQRVTGQAVELVTPMKGRFRVALLGHKGIFERKDVNYKIEE